MIPELKLGIQYAGETLVGGTVVRACVRQLYVLNLEDSWWELGESAMITLVF